MPVISLPDGMMAKVAVRVVVVLFAVAVSVIEASPALPEVGVTVSHCMGCPSALGIKAAAHEVSEWNCISAEVWFASSVTSLLPFIKIVFSGVSLLLHPAVSISIKARKE